MAVVSAVGHVQSDLVQAADSLSFLETNVRLFLDFVRNGRFSVDQVHAKFIRSYERIRLPHARAIAAPLCEAAVASLNVLQGELALQSRS